MKALLMRKPGDVILTEQPMPELMPDEVLIQIHISGICVNDVRDFKGECNFTYPRIGGHEYAGTIAAMGDGVDRKRFSIGQKVVSYIIDNCETCYFCHNGYPNVCPDFAHTECYTNPGGISGFKGFAQYAKAKDRDLFVFHDDVCFEYMALVEPIACVLNSLDQCQIEFGDDVLVIGGGTMGLLHVMLAHMRGARVILSEPMEERREKAMELGADIVVDPSREDVYQEIMKITDGLGAKTVINATAIPALAKQAIELASVCGTIVMFSSLHPNTPVEVDLGKIHSTQKRITGAQNSTPRTYWQAVQLLNKKLFDPCELIEGVYPYTEFDAAMARAMRPDTYKVMLRFV